MDVWFSIEEEPPPRGAKASWRDLKTFVSAPPERVRRVFALLTRTYHGGRQPFPNRIISGLPVTRPESRIDCGTFCKHNATFGGCSGICTSASTSYVGRVVPTAAM